MTQNALSREALPIRRILCPIDFSEFSRRAVEHALDIARVYHADVTTLFVFPLEPSGPDDGSGTRVVAPDEGARATVAQDLVAFVEPARARGIRVHLRQRAGDAAEEILAEARSMEADLIVMGTHGRSGFRRWVLGSVADQVLREAPCPVITVSQASWARHGARDFERILCAADLSPLSADTLQYAFALARTLGASVSVLHALEGSGSAPARQRARELLYEAVAEAAQEWPVAPSVVTGRPPVEILRRAADQDVALIVMGTHGSDAVDRMLFGSTLDQVVREASCPVLTVRGAAGRRPGTLSAADAAGVAAPRGR